MGKPAKETRAEVVRRVGTSLCVGSTGYLTGEKIIKS